MGRGSFFMTDDETVHDHPTADADLVLRTRSGDPAAFGELWRRHYGSGMAVARSITSRIDPDDLVQEAYTRIYQAIRRGGGPNGSFRAYLFTSIRNTAAAWGRTRTESPLEEADSIPDPRTSDQAVEEALDRGLTAQAFRSLPTRWQEVLWYTEIEQMKPAEISPLLGMKAGAVSQLAFRAREGLRAAWIQAHLRSTEAGSDCHWTIERLGGYSLGTLGTRDRGKLERHLGECTRCFLVAAEAKDVSSRLALVMLPLVLGAVGAAGYAAALQGSAAVVAPVAMPAAVIPDVVIGGAAAAGAAGGAGGAANGAGAGVGAGGAGVGAGSVGGIGALAGISAAGLLVAGVVAAAAVLPGLNGMGATMSFPAADDSAPSAISTEVSPDQSAPPSLTAPLPLLPPTAPETPPGGMPPTQDSRADGEDPVPEAPGAGAPAERPDGTDVVDPGITDPEPTDPEPTDPTPTDPEPTDPAPTDPGAGGDPGPTDPGLGGEQPGTGEEQQGAGGGTDPAPTDPDPVDPGDTDPDDGGSGTTDPDGDGGTDPAAPDPDGTDPGEIPGLPSGTPTWLDTTVECSSSWAAGTYLVTISGAPGATVRGIVRGILSSSSAEVTLDGDGLGVLALRPPFLHTGSSKVRLFYVAGDLTGPEATTTLGELHADPGCGLLRDPEEAPVEPVPPAPLIDGIESDGPLLTEEPPTAPDGVAAEPEDPAAPAGTAPESDGPSPVGDEPPSDDEAPAPASDLSTPDDEVPVPDDEVPVP